MNAHGFTRSRYFHIINVRTIWLRGGEVVQTVVVGHRWRYMLTNSRTKFFVVILIYLNNFEKNSLFMNVVFLHTKNNYLLINQYMLCWNAEVIAYRYLYLIHLNSEASPYNSHVELFSYVIILKNNFRNRNLAKTHRSSETYVNTFICILQNPAIIKIMHMGHWFNGLNNYQGDCMYWTSAECLGCHTHWKYISYLWSKYAHTWWILAIHFEFCRIDMYSK